MSIRVAERGINAWRTLILMIASSGCSILRRTVSLRVLGPSAQARGLLRQSHVVLDADIVAGRVPAYRALDGGQRRRRRGRHRCKRERGVERAWESSAVCQVLKVRTGATRSSPTTSPI
jgi:hypothetical protein